MGRSNKIILIHDFPGVVSIDRLVWDFSWLVEVLLLHFPFRRALLSVSKRVDARLSQSALGGWLLC